MPGSPITRSWDAAPAGPRHSPGDRTRPGSAHTGAGRLPPDASERRSAKCRLRCTCRASTFLGRRARGSSSTGTSLSPTDVPRPPDPWGARRPCPAMPALQGPDAPHPPATAPPDRLARPPQITAAVQAPIRAGALDGHRGPRPVLRIAMPLLPLSEHGRPRRAPPTATPACHHCGSARTRTGRGEPTPRAHCLCPSLGAGAQSRRRSRPMYRSAPALSHGALPNNQVHRGHRVSRASPGPQGHRATAPQGPTGPQAPGVPQDPEAHGDHGNQRHTGATGAPATTESRPGSTGLFHVKQPRDRHMGSQSKTRPRITSSSPRPSSTNPRCR